MFSSAKRTLATTLLCLSAASPAGALQTIDVREGQSVSAKISLTEQTRIKVDRGRIVDVYGDFYDAQRNPAGRVVLEKDDQAGEIYIRLIDRSVVRPFNIFVKSERATVGLVLQPIDMPLETIVLRERGEGAFPSGAGGVVSKTVSETPFPKNTSHVRAIKAMLLAMAGDTVPRDVQVRPLNREMALWKESRLILERIYVANSLVGEQYVLTNVSPALMVLAEPELYRDGVYAVAIDEHQLRPGQSALVYVVRARTQDD